MAPALHTEEANLHKQVGQAKLVFLASCATAALLPCVLLQLDLLLARAIMGIKSKLPASFSATTLCKRPEDTLSNVQVCGSPVLHQM